MADNKTYNQNISTDYEKKEEQSLWDKIEWWIDAGSAWLDNLLSWNKKWKIKKAQDIQWQIDTLLDRYYNWDYDIIEKNDIAKQINQLETDRDDAMKTSWRASPINEYDIWKNTRPDSSYSDFLKEHPGYSAVDDVTTKLTTEQKRNSLISNMDKWEQEQMSKFWDQVNEAIKKWETTEEEVRSWEYFMKKANDKTWQWFYWYLNEFIDDAHWMANDKTFTLSNPDWTESRFFKEDARKVISQIVTSDDVQKAVQNNYNLIKVIESWLDSDDQEEKKYAQSDFVQSIYNTAIRNLNNLKQETAYLYNKFWEYDWDVFAIEDAYFNETWRKMFSTAENSTPMAMSRAHDYSSEDWATAAMQTLNVWQDINVEYPDVWKYIWKHSVWGLFDVVALSANTVRDAIASFTEKDAIAANSLYNILFTQWLSLNDFDDMVQMNYHTQMWMWSMRSLKNELTNREWRWSKTYDTLLAVSDAAPTISKEALMFAASEWLMDSMWVMWTSEIIEETRKWAQFAKVVWWNKWLLEFDETWIIWAKLMEFYGRGIVQNFLLSSEAQWNFAEPYSNVDLWLDIAFSFIDVMTLWHWLWNWRVMIKNETRWQVLRQAMKDTLNINDEQWAKLMATSEWRNLVDKTAENLWNQWIKAIDELAVEAWKSRDEIISQMTKAIMDSSSQWWVASKLYKNSRDRIFKKIYDLEQWALAQTVAKGWSKVTDAWIKSADDLLRETQSWLKSWWFSQSIIDNLELRTVKLLNWQEQSIWWWKRALTWEEFKEVLEKTQIPAFTRIRYRMQNLLNTWWKEIHSNIQNYKDKVTELKNIDTRTDEWKIKANMLKEEINQDYNRHLKNTMVKWDADNLIATPVHYRRWEYEKYWKPYWYKYRDVEYTYLAQWNSKQEVQKVLDKRLEEYAREIEDTKLWYNYQYSAWLTREAIKFSDDITWKVNLIWMKYEKACEYNPNLKDVWQWFFISVSNANWLQVYEKNMILWSVTKWWKINWSNWVVFHITWSKYTKWTIPHQRITTFGSLFEQEHFLGKHWTLWSVKIFTKDWAVEWRYSIFKHHNWTFLRINADWKKYTIQIKEWKFLMDDHSARISWWVLDIKFTQDWHKHSHSWQFDLYGEMWDYFESRINKLKLERPQLYWYMNTMQKLELALMKNLDTTVFKNKKEAVRNWYQSWYAKDAFKERKLLSTAELKSWYLDIVDEFDVPFSYFMEVKKMVKEWTITEKEWAAMILTASGSWVVENADYFLVNKWAAIKWELQTHMFHQCWVVMIPDWSQFWYKPYFYERVTWSNWLYNLYGADDMQNAVWQLWINPETWVMIVQMWWWEPSRIYELRIDKHIWADYDSKKFTQYTIEKYDEKKEIAFKKFIEKSDQTSFNFTMVQDLDKDTKDIIKDRFSVITKWDTRWVRNKYNPDIKVNPDNQKEINDIFQFKQLSLEWNWAQWAMFYSWIKYSVLPKFFDLNVWTRDRHEWAEALKWAKYQWMDHKLDFIDISWDDVRFFIDTKEMWFDVNYMYNEDVKKWTLILRVQDWTPDWRIVSIDYVWKFNIQEMDWNLYMRVWLTNEDGYDYYIKLTPDIERLNAYEINTLSLSKNDYDQFILNQDRMRKAIWTKSWFIYNNMLDFPQPVRDLIFRWWTETEVYTAMKWYIQQNDMMKEIAAVKWVNLETATMEQMLNISKEYDEVVLAIKDIAQLWYEVSSDKMLQYYKYLYWENTFWASSVVDIIDWKAWLSLFRQRAVSSWIREWLTNLVALDRWWQNLSASFYNYAQSRIMWIRLAKFEEDFNAWVFSDWLDLTKAVDYQEYQNRVKEAYQYATQITNTSDIRTEWYSMRRRWMLKKYQWQRQHMQALYANANNVNDLSQVLISAKKSLWDISWIRWTWKKAQKKIDKKFNKVREVEPWVNRYEKLFFDKNWNKRSIEQIADVVQEEIDMWFTIDEIWLKIAQGLMEDWWAHYWLNKITELEKRFLQSSDEYKSLFEGSRLSLWNIENLNSVRQPWAILDINFDKDIKMLENTLVVPKNAGKSWSNKPREWMKAQIRQLRKDANMILEFNKMWEDVSSLVEDYIKTRQEIIIAYQNNVASLSKDININTLETKKSLNQTYNETKKTEILDQVVEDTEFTFSQEKPKRTTNWWEWWEDISPVEIQYTKEVYWIESLEELQDLKNKKWKERAEIRDERNAKQTKLKKEWDTLSQDEKFKLEEDIIRLNAEETKLDIEMTTIYTKIWERENWWHANYIFDMTDETTIRLTKEYNALADEYYVIETKLWEFSDKVWNNYLKWEWSIPKKFADLIKRQQELDDLLTDLKIEIQDYKDSLDVIEATNTEMNVIRDVEDVTWKEPIEAWTDVEIDTRWQDLEEIQIEEKEEVAFMWTEDIKETVDAVEEIKEVTKKLDAQKEKKKAWRPKKEKQKRGDIKKERADTYMTKEDFEEAWIDYYETRQMFPVFNSELDDIFWWADITFDWFWTSFYEMIDRLLYEKRKDANWSLILNDMTSDCPDPKCTFLKQFENNWNLYREWYKKLLKSENLHAFLKSEEWMSLVLWCTYYHIPLPYKIIDAINRSYWLNLQPKLRLSYDDAFNTIKSTLENRFNLKIDWYKNYDNIWYWYWRIQHWNKNSYFNQLTVFPNDEVFIPEWKMYDKDWNYIKPEWNPIFVYWADKNVTVNAWEVDIYNPKLTSSNPKVKENYDKLMWEYQAYLKKVVDNGSYYSTRNWMNYISPMSPYEFYTLLELSKTNEVAKDYLFNILDSNWAKRMDVTIWIWETEWDWFWKLFYEALSDWDNRVKFREDFWINARHSQYFWSKQQDYLDKQYHWYNEKDLQTITTDMDTFQKMFLNWDKMYDNRKYYKEIVIKWWETNENLAFLKKYQTDFDVNIKYEWEISVRPKAVETPIPDKQAKSVQDSTTLEAKKMTCKK